MNFQQQHHALHIQLLGFSRLSQRALDYAIKGFQLGSLDFCESAFTDSNEAEKYYRLIKKICCHQIKDKAIHSSYFRFALASLRLNSALYTVYCASAKMLQRTMQLSESDRMSKCAALNGLGDVVNSLMRLCTIAFFNQETEYAEWVIQRQDVWRQCEFISEAEYGDDHRWSASQDIFAVTITRSLGDIAKQAHEIADAILFWLRENDSVMVLRDKSAASMKFIWHGGDIAVCDHPNTAMRDLPAMD
jgi:hypothetical protein